MITAQVSSGWELARPASPAATQASWNSSVATNSDAGSGWKRATSVSQDRMGLAWNEVPAKDVHSLDEWREAASQDAGAASRWGTVPPKDAGEWVGWDHSIRPFDVRLRLLYDPKPDRKDADQGGAWFRSNEHQSASAAADALKASLYVPSLALDFSFQGNRYSPTTQPLVFFDFKYTRPVFGVHPVDSTASPAYGTAQVLDLREILPWGWSRPADPIATGIEYPDYPGPVVVIDPPPEPDILETYMIANTVTLAVLSSGTPLDATSIKVSRDIDSFSWTFSAELFGRTSLNLVRPDANGPKTVELFINGWRWLFLVEKYSGQGKFPSERYTISGGSRVQLLADPYAPKRSTLNSAQVNARQAAEDELLDTGFTITWDTVSVGPPDWTLPAGAYSYQGQTALQVIAKIAEVVGGVVSPARDSDALTILPRYREAVWNWSGAVMDRIIPAEVVSEWGSEWSPQPEWNTVYVSGTNYGVGVQVRRSGTAGDDPAADVMEDWMTGTDAARSRGISELSKGGNQEIVTLNLPLFPVDSNGPGLIEPAMLCEVRDPDETWRGLCLGVDISADGVGASKVSQSLRLERHYAGGA